MIFKDRLYKFTESKEAGAFDGTKVVPCNIASEFNEKIASVMEDTNRSFRTKFSSISSALAVPVNSSVDVDFVCEERGFYCVQLYASPCGAKNGSITVQIYKDGNDTNEYMANGRRYAYIPIPSNNWDGLNSCTVFMDLYESAYKAKFINNTSESTSSNYGGSYSVFGFKIW